MEGALGRVSIHALAVATATGRTIVYASTAGGLTTTTALRNLAASGETLLAPGAYRYTTRQVGIQGGDLNGPATGLVQHASTFSALVNPTTATVPIRYEWQVTDQSPVTHTTGSLSDSAIFTWTSPGAQVITVTVSNIGGAASFTHVVAINAPLSTVDISGPAKGLVNTAHAFTASASPAMTTLPITYTWQATGLSPVTHVSDLSDTVVLIWSTPGTKVVTVLADNGVSAQVANVHTITVEPYHLYLPLILRNG